MLHLDLKRNQGWLERPGCAFTHLLRALCKLYEPLWFKLACGDDFHVRSENFHPTVRPGWCYFHVQCGLKSNDHLKIRESPRVSGSACYLWHVLILAFLKNANKSLWLKSYKTALSEWSVRVKICFAHLWIVQYAWWPAFVLFDKQGASLVSNSLPNNW